MAVLISSSLRTAPTSTLADPMSTLINAASHSDAGHFWPVTLTGLLWVFFFFSKTEVLWTVSCLYGRLCLLEVFNTPARTQPSLFATVRLRLSSDFFIQIKSQHTIMVISVFGQADHIHKPDFTISQHNRNRIQLQELHLQANYKYNHRILLIFLEAAVPFSRCCRGWTILTM
jgi:hypothetical protein